MSRSELIGLGGSRAQNIEAALTTVLELIEEGTLVLVNGLNIIAVDEFSRIIEQAYEALNYDHDEEDDEEA